MRNEWAGISVCDEWTGIKVSVMSGLVLACACMSVMSIEILCYMW